MVLVDNRLTYFVSIVWLSLLGGRHRTYFTIFCKLRLLSLVIVIFKGIVRFFERVSTRWSLQIFESEYKNRNIRSSVSFQNFRTRSFTVGCCFENVRSTRNKSAEDAEDPKFAVWRLNLGFPFVEFARKGVYSQENWVGKRMKAMHLFLSI